jgi:VWFA-related protein
MGSRVAAATAALALASALVSGQQPTPTFRAEVNYVQLPVRVLDGKGNFVRDLKALDFQVYEDGQLQTISNFRLVDFPPPNAKAPATVTISPGVMTIDKLEQLDGRVYMFLLDDYHIGVQYSARAKDIVRSFIRDRMAANDVAAVMMTSGAKGQDFTPDKRLLLAAVDRFTGVLDANEPAQIKELKARTTVKVLASVADALAQIRGRHKAVIYVGTSVGCLVSREAATGIRGTNFQQDPYDDLTSAGTGGAPDSNVPILCSEQTWDTARAAVQGDASIYSIDPRGGQVPGWISPTVDGRGGPARARERMAMAEPGRPSVFDGFYVLPDATGGFAVTGTNAFNQALDRIVRESSSYYLLGYSSTNDKADGKFRKTAIKVARPDVQVFYRPGYLGRRQ